MKGFFGNILFMMGLGFLVVAVEKETSIWFFMLAAGVIGIGLDLVIDGRIEDFNK